jgi:hypothetical protein
VIQYSTIFPSFDAINKSVAKYTKKQEVVGRINRLLSIHFLKKLNSVAWVPERTIPTERPSLVGEVSANFC